MTTQGAVQCTQVGCTSWVYVPPPPSGPNPDKDRFTVGAFEKMNANLPAWDFPYPIIKPAPIVTRVSLIYNPRFAEGMDQSLQANVAVYWNVCKEGIESQERYAVIRICRQAAVKIGCDVIYIQSGIHNTTDGGTRHDEYHITAQFYENRAANVRGWCEACQAQLFNGPSATYHVYVHFVDRRSSPPNVHRLLRSANPRDPDVVGNIELDYVSFGIHSDSAMTRTLGSLPPRHRSSYPADHHHLRELHQQRVLWRMGHIVDLLKELLESLANVFTPNFHGLRFIRRAQRDVRRVRRDREATPNPPKTDNENYYQYLTRWQQAVDTWRADLPVTVATLQSIENGLGQHSETRNKITEILVFVVSFQAYQHPIFTLDEEFVPAFV